MIDLYLAEITAEITKYLAIAGIFFILLFFLLIKSAKFFGCGIVTDTLKYLLDFDWENTTEKENDDEQTTGKENA